MSECRKSGRWAAGAALATSLFAAGAALAAQARELLAYKNIRVSVADDYRCQPTASVRLDAAEPDDFLSRRMDMQEVANVTRTYLWLDCPELQGIDFAGHAGGSAAPVYRASSHQASGWRLDEGLEPERADAGPDAQPLPAAPPAAAEPPEPAPETLDDLEQAAANGSEAAALKLASGLLDLPNVDPAIDFADDPARGFEILETLAAAGNADAAHLLGEAYRRHATRPLNPSLLSRLLGQPGGSDRSDLAAKLTVAAATRGSQEAIAALQQAGAAGLSSAYYALGQMYLLDSAGRMPVAGTFLHGRLGLPAGSGGRGNVSVGLQFLRLAAAGGHGRAASMLRELGVRPTPTAPGRPSTSAASRAPAASTPPAGVGMAGTPSTSAAVTASLGSVLSGSLLDDILQQAQGSGSGAPASPASSSAARASGAGPAPTATAATGSTAGARGGSSSTATGGGISPGSGVAGAGGTAASSSALSGQATQPGSSPQSDTEIID